ncbi:hypothetical protein PDJAM_G00081160 [Pangasius djambal]|uniref:Uncharacterized protein n=1 Tax=Pangasius djambal TaxID=1691987 RepID=A0ACC5Z2T7_9TELE|nr:hypothetical protein [Pangasius djambal]
MNSFPFNSCFDSDCGFDSHDMDFDELDCSDPLAMSGRCDLHKGLRIEVSKEPLSMRRIANVIIALQRLKHTQNIRSTEFTDQELFNIILENVIEETIVIDLNCSESKSYSRQDKVVQCTICDKSKRALVRRENLPILLAITLKGGNEKNKAWFNLSAYTPPNCTDTRGQPVCLGIVKSNFFLSCTMENGTPFLGIEEVKDKESLKAIKENDGMERFLFFRNGTGESLNTFESVKYPGWFITTSKDDFKPVQMSLTRQGMDSTTPLKVCCGIWHQAINSRSFKSCKLQAGASMDRTCLSSTSHRRSIRLSSGEFEGQVNTTAIREYEGVYLVCRKA